MNSSGKRFFYRTHTEEISLEETREPAEELDQRERNELRARLLLHRDANMVPTSSPCLLNPASVALPDPVPARPGGASHHQCGPGRVTG